MSKHREAQIHKSIFHFYCAFIRMAGIVRGSVGDACINNHSFDWNISNTSLELRAMNGHIDASHNFLVLRQKNCVTIIINFSKKKKMDHKRYSATVLVQSPAFEEGVQAYEVGALALP